MHTYKGALKLFYNALIQTRHLTLIFRQAGIPFASDKYLPPKTNKQQTKRNKTMNVLEWIFFWVKSAVVQTISAKHSYRSSFK